MKILVLSDTHGNIERALEVCRGTEGINLVLHCGDYKSDATDISREIGVPVIGVTGNCDAYTALPSDREKAFIDTPGGKIMITHGHKERVDYDYATLSYLGEENDCNAVCFGHTHVPVVEEMGNILLVNPGSLSLPRDGSNGSFAIIESTEDGITGKIVYYDDFIHPAPPTKKKKVQGGYLRGLLNYSDRF